MGTCINHLVYADDICCIAPSLKGLQKLVDECWKYADVHNITFNPSKTKAMWFKTKYLDLNFTPKLCINNDYVEFVSKVKYLGGFLNCNLKDDDDICRQLRSTYTTADMLRSKFSCCSVVVKNCLFRTFCSAKYGVGLWSSYLQSCHNRIRVAYNNAYRILFNLPRKISISTIMVQNRITSFQSIRRKGTAMFLTRCHLSTNEYIYNTVGSDDFKKSKFYTSFIALHF